MYSEVQMKKGKIKNDELFKESYKRKGRPTTNTKIK